MSEQTVVEGGYAITYANAARDALIVRVRKGFQEVRIGMKITLTEGAHRVTGVPDGERGEVVRLNHPFHHATTSDFIVAMGGKAQNSWRLSLTLRDVELH